MCLLLCFFLAIGVKETGTVGSRGSQDTGKPEASVSEGGGFDDWQEDDWEVCSN